MYIILVTIPVKACSATVAGWSQYPRLGRFELEVRFLTPCNQLSADDDGRR